MNDTMTTHPIARFVANAGAYEDDESPVDGAWLSFTILGGNNFLASRVIEGIAFYDETFGLIGIARRFSKHANLRWADTITWLNPEHVVTVAYAQSGATEEEANS